MKAVSSLLILSAVSIAVPLVAISADTMDQHTTVAPGDVEWGPGPASIPPGAEAVVLYGDPGKEGLFAMRLKLPAGYHIAPHSHPKPEVVTVISGAFRLGMGEKADPDKGETLPAGGFVALPPGMAHYAYFDEETVLQLNSTGPWALTYVNPEDDPRQ